MIPLKLEITNFLSYRQTAVLDFRGIHLACISGANGAGKSSILDAMTWALFGQSRSKSDDDLVNRLAAREDETAEVRFTFDLENTIYRIARRKRVRKSTVLELQIAVELDDSGQPASWKTLSESKVAETQAAIVDLLRMNFDSFINASFFLQGKADEFTTKTPARRKEILAELLGINVWDQYKDKVMEQRKAKEVEIQLQTSRIEEIDAELGEETERKEKVARLEAEYEKIKAQLNSRELVLGDLRQIETAVITQKEQLETSRRNHQRAVDSLQNLHQSKAKQEAELNKHEMLLEAKADIEADYAKWEQLGTAVKGWQMKANQHNQFERKMEPLRLTIAETRSRLEQSLLQMQRESKQAEEAAQELKTLTPELGQLQKELKKVGEQIAQFNADTAAYQKAQSALQQAEGERALMKKEYDQLQAESRRMAALEKNQTNQRDHVADAQKALDELEPQLIHINELARERATLEAEITSMSADQPRLKVEMEELKAKMNQLSKESGSHCPLCGQALTESHRQQVLADIQEQGKEMADRYRQNKDRLADHQTKLTQIEVEIRQLPKLERQQTAQRERLARAQAQLEESDQTLAAWDANGRLSFSQLESRLAETSVIDSLKAEVATLEAAVQTKSTLEEQQTNHQKVIAHKEARQQTLQKQIERWEKEGAPALKALEMQLANLEFAQEAQAELAKLEGEQTELGYDAQAHEEAAKNQKGLEDAPVRQQALNEAATAKSRVINFIETLNEQIDAQKKTVQDYEKQIAQLEENLATLETSSSDLKRVEKEVQTLRQDEIQANRDLGAARQSLGVLADQRARRETLSAEKIKMSNALQQLKLLEEACGRDGVQALLIEAAVPEIEERANELLERLTAGGMRVMFQTQRKLKSRKAETRETLDIRIIDDAGERPYGNFSGGEQFRVNFAIRLALSQMLARRAGAKLQTLVIDEGFGSQDPNGRQRLIEAINTIQADFEQILVITHIEELREAFPNRIEVEKSRGGSQITVQ